MGSVGAGGILKGDGGPGGDHGGGRRMDAGGRVAADGPCGRQGRRQGRRPPTPRASSAVCLESLLLAVACSNLSPQGALHT